MEEKILYKCLGTHRRYRKRFLVMILSSANIKKKKKRRVPIILEVSVIIGQKICTGLNAPNVFVLGLFESDPFSQLPHAKHLLLSRIQPTVTHHAYPRREQGERDGKKSKSRCFKYVSEENSKHDGIRRKKPSAACVRMRSITSHTALSVSRQRGERFITFCSTTAGSGGQEPGVDE